MADEWPSDDDRAAPIPFLTAFGQIALAYNIVEAMVEQVFMHIAPLDNEYSKTLFHALSNRERIDLLIAFARKNEKNPGVVDAISHFMHCYNICTDNRNILMHVIGLDVSETAGRWTKRASKNPLREIEFHVSLADMREVASQMADTFNYAVGLNYFLFDREFRNAAWRGEPPTLPEKLPKLRTLTPYQPVATRKDAPPRPQSSEA